MTRKRNAKREKKVTAPTTPVEPQASTPGNTALPSKVQKKLSKLRDAIDSADRDLLKSLQKRNKAVEQVGKLKQKFNLPIVQPERWKEVVEHRVKRGNKLKIGEKFLRAVLELIHEESVYIQQRGKK